MVKIIIGKNDLFSTNPELREEWDYSNNALSPTTVTAGSHKKVWWKCERGHEWHQEIRLRLRDNHLGCPYCSGQLASPGVNDLATLYPDLMLEWDCRKNEKINPSEISAFSNKRVWWRCKKGHEWQAPIDARTSRNRGCPYCANQKVLSGYNDLQSLYPRLAAEWNYERNGTITPDQIIAHSGKKYWWRCEKGHEWEATVTSRVNGNGCRQCARELATSFPEQAVYFYLSSVFRDTINGYSNNKISEIDVYIPNRMVGIEYDGQFYHKDRNREVKKNMIAQEEGITLFRIKEDSLLDYSESRFIETDNVFYYDPRNKDTLNTIIVRLFQILGVTDIPKIDVLGDRVAIWSQYINMAKAESLQARYPELSTEWNYNRNGGLTPDKVSCKSGKKVWWVCSNCGNEWEATISHRTSGTDCPNCASKKISEKVGRLIPGENDLVTKRPDLMEEWDYEKNVGIDPHYTYFHSRQMVWWKCKRCENTFRTSIIQRTLLNTNCNNCTYAMVRGSLAEKYPGLCAEWDYTKNTDLDPENVSPGSGKKVWWKCSVCGNEWQARIGHRTNGTGCPRCKNRCYKKTQ